MSISAKLSDIRTAISSAYTAVSNMGGTVPALPTLNALPSAIQTIPTGGGGDSRFYDLIARTSTLIEDSTVTDIGIGAFAYWSTLTTASFPSCTTIGDYVFYGCSTLTTASFPVCTTIGRSAFAYCSTLTTASFPVCTTIGPYAFARCSNLATASFPVCTSIDNNAFSLCSNLATVSFPVCTSIAVNAFFSCSNLATVSFPMCTYIGEAAFSKCTKLKTIYIGTSNCVLSKSNAFSTTGIWSAKGSIYVPSAYVTAYKTATNWTFFSARIFGY